MNVEAFAELLNDPLETREHCCAEIDAMRQVHNMADARIGRAMTRLEEIARSNPSVSPEHDHANATRGTASQGARAGRRAKAANETMPSLGEGMAAGSISGELVDVIANALTSLPTQAERDAFVEFEPQLCRAAETLTRGELAKTVEM